VPLPSIALNIVSVLILLAAAWPIAELLAKGQFRRTFPKLAASMAIVLALYVAGIGILGWYLPWLAAALAAIAGVGMAFQLWRSRSNFGRSRGLPPGSLSLLPAGAWLDPAFYQKQGEMYGPVFKSSHFLNPMVCIIGLETGFEILRKYEDDAVIPPEAAFARFIPCSYIRSMSPENHKKYRPILQAAVSNDVTDLLVPASLASISARLDRFAEDCRNENVGLRLKPYATDALYEVMFRVFFGVMPGSPEHREFLEIYKILDLSHQRRATAWSPAEKLVRATLRDTIAKLGRQIDTFPGNANAGNPTQSYLESAWRYGGAAAVDEIVLLNLIYLMQVTCTDLVGLFDWILKKMSDHPNWRQRLFEMMQTHGVDSPEVIDLSERIVAETFRLEQSEHIYRKIVKPMEVNGFHIPKGWLLRICVRESHHCSPVFEDPESFNPDRFLNRTYGPTEYAPFGMFHRRCIGVYTGRRLGGCLVRALVGGFEWEVTDPGTPDFRGWHWTPGADFRVRLQPRAAALRHLNFSSQ